MYITLYTYMYILYIYAGQFAKYGTSGADLSLLTPYSAEEEQTDFPLAPVSCLGVQGLSVPCT